MQLINFSHKRKNFKNRKKNEEIGQKYQAFSTQSGTAQLAINPVIDHIFMWKWTLKFGFVQSY